MSILNRKLKSAAVIGVGALCAIAAGGCSKDSDELPGIAHPTVAIVDRTINALKVDTISAIHGTYGAACRSHVSGDPWSVAIGGTAASDELSVVLNDTACELTLTAVTAAATTYVGDPSIPLGLTYKGTASSFPTGAPVFYANAKIASLLFAANFQITLLVSDDPGRATEANTASAATVTSTAVANQVPAPEYTLDASGIAVTTDTNDAVHSATGSATLNLAALAQAGELYVVDGNDSLGEFSTYAEIDAFYGLGAPTAIAPIDASEFNLTGTLPLVRNVIISHTEEGVRSYEVIRVTFSSF